jgi:RHS repeat-associated protein
MQTSSLAPRMKKPSGFVWNARRWLSDWLHRVGFQHMFPLLSALMAVALQSPIKAQQSPSSNCAKFVEFESLISTVRGPNDSPPPGQFTLTMGSEVFSPTNWSLDSFTDYWFSTEVRKIQVVEGVPIMLHAKENELDNFELTGAPYSLHSMALRVPEWVQRFTVKNHNGYYATYVRHPDGIWGGWGRMPLTSEIGDGYTLHGPDAYWLTQIWADSTEWPYGPIYITFYGDDCSSCGSGSSPDAAGSPSVHTSPDSSPLFSMPLSIGGACCGNSGAGYASWTTNNLSDAVNPQSIHAYVLPESLAGGRSVRYPADGTLPISQFLTDSALSVSESTATTLSWKVYEATSIDPRPNDQSPFPLTKNNGSAPLPLLSETRITKETDNSTLIQHFEGSELVASFRLTDTMEVATATRLIENLNTSAGVKETVSTRQLASGSWRTATRMFHQTGNASWTMTSGVYRIESVATNMPQVLEEGYCGIPDDGSQDTWDNRYAYYSDSRLKCRQALDGFWEFREYTTSETIVYGPYGDTAFPGTAFPDFDWNPGLSPLTGIRSDRLTGGSSASFVGLTQVSSTDFYSYSDDYTVTEESTTGGFTRSSISTNSYAPAKVFQSRTIQENDGRGVTTLHQYTRGNVDSVGFHADVTGEHLMEIVSVGPTAEVPELLLFDQELIADPVTIGAAFTNVATREVRIQDPKGRTLFSATQVLDNEVYSVATGTLWTYTSLPNNEGEVITELRDGRVVATSSSLSDGTWEENVDQSGSVRTTVRDLLGRVTTETSPGPEGSTITRSYIHDGLTTTITTSGGGLSLSTSETRDLRGRVVSSTDQTGIVTGSSYTDGGRTTTITRPGGVTEITTNYLDGRFKQRSGSGVIREFASYEIDEATGNELTKRSSGPAIVGDHGARWTETTTDKLGRTVSIRRPGPPNGTGGRQADVTESYSYSPTTGKLASIVSSARPGIYQLMEEDLLGTWSTSGTATHSGPLVANSSDRFSTTARTYEKRNGRFWEVTTRSTFVQGSTPVSTSTATLMWVLGGEESEYTDAASVTSTRTTIYDLTHKTAVTSSGNALQGYTAETTINGFLKKRSIPGAAQDEAFVYDGLGREICHTDVRNASYHTIYNNLGQVEKVVDHLGQSMSYTYYPANHQSAGRVHTQTDAAGKSIETSYDTLGRVFSTGGNATYPVSYTYDGFGERETLTTYGTETAVTTWVNDPPTGLLLEKKYHGQANGVKYAYLGDGRPESRTWRRGATTTYRYDSPGNAFGDLDTIDYPVGTPDVSFSNFDRLGRPGTVTEGGNVTTLTYNSLTGETSTTYDGAHGILPGLSVVMKSPNSGRPGGYTLQKSGISTPLLEVDYGYDDFNRMQTIGTGAHTVTYGYYPGTGVLRESTHTVAGGGTPRIETRSVDLAGRTTGVVTTVPIGTGRRIAASAGYMLNDRGLREKLTREDGTSWNFGYNDRSEVTSGVKKLVNGDLAAGLQFGYQFDGIGNREWAKSGGDPSGENLRTVNYTPNALNQYSEITTPGSFDVLVRSQDAVGVEVNESSVPVTNQEGFHRAEATATNTDGAWTDLNITSPVGQNSVTGHRWLQPAVFSPGNDAGGELNNHDDDGNLTDDGRWTYAWDAENRLASVTINQSAADLGAPKRRLEFFYDWQGRRIAKKVLSTSSTTLATASWNIVISDERFVYNGWNTLAVFDASGSTLTAKQTILWGLDLSGTLEGAGGVSGLLAVNTVSPQSVCYPAFDGNGNIIAWTATNGDTLQRIDHDPFGNIVTREGVAGFEAPAWGFSTKYQDRETGLIYFGYRFYDPETGRWLSRDPIGENGGPNIYAACGNNTVNVTDLLGLKVSIGVDNMLLMKLLSEAESQVNKSMFGSQSGLSHGIGMLKGLYRKKWMKMEVIYAPNKSSSYWDPLFEILYLRDKTSVTAVHESVHLYNYWVNPLNLSKFNANDDEGLAYAFESVFTLVTRAPDFSFLFGNASKNLGTDEQLIKTAEFRWRGMWDGRAYGGDLVYDHTTEQPLELFDFQRARNVFGVSASCRGIAKQLNESPLAKKLCIEFSCDPGARETIGITKRLKTGGVKIHEGLR